MDNRYELAMIAYTAYGNSVRWLTYNGEWMRNFDDLPPPVKEGWQAAAEMVVKYVTRDREGE